MSKKVAVILVNYKDYAERFLIECRDSLRAQNYPKDFFKVYIVDNASSGTTKKYLEDNMSEAEILVREDGNYTAANNAGIKKGMADGCEYFIAVNMDVKLDVNWLSELVKAAGASSETGIVQSKILLYPKTREEWQSPKINTLGNIIHYLGFGFTSHYGEADAAADQTGTPSEIAGYASGCSMLIKKEVLEKIGAYDEEYYMYHDDIEMSWKAKLAGYKIMLAPASVVYHKYEFDRSVRMLYYMERNRYIAMLSFYSWQTLALLLPPLIVMEAGMLLFSIFKGWFKIKADVYAYFLNKDSWQKIADFREKIAKIRVKKDKEIVADFASEIEFTEIANPLLKYIGNPFFKFYWNLIKPFIE